MPDFSPIINDAYREILERSGDPQGIRNYNRLMNQGMSEAEMELVMHSNPLLAIR